MSETRRFVGGMFGGILGLGGLLTFLSNSEENPDTKEVVINEIGAYGLLALVVAFAILFRMSMPADKNGG